jgi:hypothetical protein
MKWKGPLLHRGAGHSLEPLREKAVGGVHARPAESSQQIQPQALVTGQTLHRAGADNAAYARIVEVKGEGLMNRSGALSKSYLLSSGSALCLASEIPRQLTVG